QPLARTNLHRGEEPGKVVLDAREVHLIQDHVELTSGPLVRVRALPLASRLLNELAERRVVIEAVERRQVAEEVFVRGPARIDRHEPRLRARSLGVRLREPRLTRATRS